MQTECHTRQRILDAALPLFANQGYAATSVQDIVDAAQVSKPALYYHFTDKAGLYRALVQLALDDRFRLMQEAAGRATSSTGQLTAILSSLFVSNRGSQDLLRIALAAAFAAPKEVPLDGRRMELAQRNYGFFRGIIERGQRDGEFDPQRSADELAFALYGQLNIHLMVRLLDPQHPLTAEAAERVVELFLAGARPAVTPALSHAADSLEEPKVSLATSH